MSDPRRSTSHVALPPTSSYRPRRVHFRTIRAVNNIGDEILHDGVFLDGRVEGIQSAGHRI